MINPTTDLQPGLLTPKRHGGLVNRVMGFFARYQRDIGPQESEQQTTQTGTVVDSVERNLGQEFFLSDNRILIYRDVDEMDSKSEEVSVALDIISDNSVTSDDGVQQSFQITAKDLKVQKVLDRAAAVCNLHTAIKPLIRNLVKYGDSFNEIVVNSDMELASLRQLPPETMLRNQDLHGNLLMGAPKYDAQDVCTNVKGECAYEQTDPEDTRKVVAAFWPWQIIHIRLNHDGFSPYGRSELRTARHAWKRLRAIEDAMVVARLTRAYLKLVHYLDGSGLAPDERDEMLRRYKQNLTLRKRQDSERAAPFQVMTDLFVTTGSVVLNGQVTEVRSKIEPIDPRSSDVHEIADIEYLHKKLLATLRVPPAHMGFEKEVNAKSTLTMQDVQFVRWLRALQQLVGQALEQFFDIALALEGIDPASAEYTISWPMLKATDELSGAQALFAKAQAVALLLGNSQQNGTPVVTPRWVLENILKEPSDDIEEVLKELEELKQQQQQEQQAQQDMAHQRQMELNEQSATLQAKNQPPAPTKPAAKKRPVAQEVGDFSRLLAARVTELLEPDLDSFSRDQRVTLERFRSLTQDHRELQPQTTPILPGQVVEIHHKHTGEIEHSHGGQS